MRLIPGIKTALLKIVLVSQLLTLVACFDYEERLEFNNDFSGRVYYDYNIPIFADSKRSMLKFLPLSEERIVENLEREIFDYKVEFYHDPEHEPSYQNRARINYYVEFEKPSELQQLLLGKSRIIFDKKNLSIVREFPQAKAPTEETDRLIRQLFEFVERTLSEHNLKFIITIPPIYVMKSNLGQLLAPNRLVYTLPLDKSMRQQKDVEWKIDITTNPFSQALR